MLHVLAPPFFSGPSAEGSAVRSHGKKRWSLHRRKRNQAASAAGAPSRGTRFCSRYGSCDLLESGFPVLHHLHHDSSGTKWCLVLSQKQERIKEVEVKMSSFLRSLTSWRYLHSASQVFDGKHSLLFRRSYSLLLSLSPSSPDGLQLTKEEKREQFHFLVFTDVFGNKTHGVVMQYYRPILVHKRINKQFVCVCVCTCA